MCPVVKKILTSGQIRLSMPQDGAQGGSHRPCAARISACGAARTRCCAARRARVAVRRGAHALLCGAQCALCAQDAFDQRNRLTSGAPTVRGRPPVGRADRGARGATGSVVDATRLTSGQTNRLTSGQTNRLTSGQTNRLTSGHRAWGLAGAQLRGRGALAVVVVVCGGGRPWEMT